jgi:NAD(P)-dependent dehydrogenase (short-subunit alcohol dehydrogenase family)
VRPRTVAGQHGGVHDLSGKVAVVAGVGPGLGRAVALALAAAGAEVVVAARDEGRVADLATEVAAGGGSATAVRADITDAADRRRVVDAAVDAHGRLDVLVGNAFAMGPMRRALDLEPDDWRAVLEVNVVGTVALATEVARWMVDHGGGSIVLVGSQAARRPAPRRGPYAASKAALLVAAQVLAAELGPAGVRVNTVVPGPIWGEALEGHYRGVAERRGVDEAEVLREVVADVALRRIASADEVAAAIVFLASDRASGITGQSLDVNCGNWFS